MAYLRMTGSIGQYLLPVINPLQWHAKPAETGPQDGHEQKQRSQAETEPAAASKVFAAFSAPMVVVRSTPAGAEQKDPQPRRAPSTSPIALPWRVIAER